MKHCDYDKNVFEVMKIDKIEMNKKRKVEMQLSRNLLRKMSN